MSLYWIICFGSISYMIIGKYLWFDIDKKTMFEENDDGYLKLPIMFGSFFCYFFIKKISEKRKIYYMENKINSLSVRIKYIGYSSLRENEKNIWINYNRYLKIKKLKIK